MLLCLRASPVLDALLSVNTSPSIPNPHIQPSASGILPKEAREVAQCVQGGTIS